MTRVFNTEDEAIEAWNTWRGRYQEVDPDIFCQSNPCNAGALVVDSKGDYVPLPHEDVIGGAVMLSNGAFIVPWPRLAPAQAKAAKQVLQVSDRIGYVASLCARWCALFPSVVEYRERLAAVLRANDRENKLLNLQLQKWNEYLGRHGFTPFEHNDMRGVNLSGFRLQGATYAGIWLRNVDLSFSELSLTQLQGANLYGARLQGLSSAYASFGFAVCSGADFSHGCLSNAHFDGADLSNANLSDCLCHRASFDGAMLIDVALTGSQCTEISLQPLAYTHHGVEKRRHAVLHGVQYARADFRGTNTENVDWTKNPAMKAEIERQNDVFRKDKKRSLWNRIVDATELKPGWLGFSLDLKKVLKK